MPIVSTGQITITDYNDTAYLDLSIAAAFVDTDTNGNGAVFTSSHRTTASIRLGATDDSAAWTFSVALASITGTSSNANRTFDPTGLSADTGTVTFTAIKDGVTLSKVFSVTKNKQGLTGVSVKLNASTQGFTYTDNVLDPSPQVILLEVIKNQTTAAAYFVASNGATITNENGRLNALGFGLGTFNTMSDSAYIDSSVLGSAQSVDISVFCEGIDFSDTVTLSRTNKSTAGAGATKNIATVGTLAQRPTVAAVGDTHFVTGDATPDNNGRLWLCTTAPNTWTLGGTNNQSTSSAIDPVNANGSNGDSHYNTATKVLWVKIAGVWIAGANQTTIDPATGVITGVTTGGGISIDNTRVVVGTSNLVPMGNFPSNAFLAWSLHTAGTAVCAVSLVQHATTTIATGTPTGGADNDTCYVIDTKNLWLRTAGVWNANYPRSTNGILSCNITVTDGVTVNIQIYTTTWGMNLVVGQQYTISVWLRSTVAGNGKISVLLKDTPWSLQGTALTVAITTTWTKFTHTFTATSNAPSRVNLELGTMPVSTVYAKEVQVETGPVATAWGPSNIDIDNQVGMARAMTYTVFSYCTRSGRTFTKTGGVNSTWDTGFVSNGAIKGGSIISFTPATPATGFMIGFTTEIPISRSYANINYALYCAAGIAYFYKLGVDSGVATFTYLATDTITLVNNGSSVDVKKNGVSQTGYPIACSIMDYDAPMYLKASMYTTSASISNLRFTSYYEELSVGDLNAMSIKAGTVAAENIVAGTVTGSTLQTSASGKRFKVSASAGEAVMYDDNVGTDVLVASIGINIVGSDRYPGYFYGGSYNSANFSALYAKSENAVSVYALSMNGTAISGVSPGSQAIAVHGFAAGTRGVGGSFFGTGANLHMGNGATVPEATNSYGVSSLKAASTGKNGASEIWQSSLDASLVSLVQKMHMGHHGALIYNVASTPTTTLIVWNSAAYDTDVCYSTSQKTRLTVPTNWQYVRLSVCLSHGGTTSGIPTVLTLYKNGVSTFIGRPSQIHIVSANHTEALSLISPVLSVVAGDYFEVYQTGGGANADATGYSTWFSIELIS